MKPQPKKSDHGNLKANQQQVDVEDPQDKSAIEILSHETQMRKREKLSPIIRSNSGHQEQLIQQYNNPQSFVTPKNETITERLQTFGHVDLLKQSKSFRKLIVYFHQKDFIKMLLNPFKLTSSFIDNLRRRINYQKLDILQDISI